MWTDAYLKFSGVEEATLQLKSMPEGTVIDTLGVLWQPAVYNEEGTLVTPAVAEAGWYVNLRLQAGVGLPLSLAPFALETPQFPKRVFLES